MALVQSNTGQNGTTGTSYTVTLPGTVTPGDCLILAANNIDQHLISAVSSPGATWAQTDAVTCSQANFGAGGTAEGWYANNCLGGVGSGVITITLSASTTSGHATAGVYEFTGVALTSALDAHGSNSNVTESGLATAVVTPAITTTVNGDLVVAIVSSKTPVDPLTWPAGFTQLPGFAVAVHGGVGNSPSSAIYGSFAAGSVQGSFNCTSSISSSVIFALKQLSNQPGYDTTISAGTTTLTLSGFIGSPDTYIIEDIYGNQVATGAVTASFLNLTSAGWAPGWSMVRFTKAGVDVDSLQITAVRSGVANLPLPPVSGTSPNAGETSGTNIDSYLHGFTALGYQRYQINDAGSPTVAGGGAVGGSIAAIAAEIALEQGAAGYLNPTYADSARPRAAVVQFPNSLSSESGYAAGVTSTVTSIGPGTSSNVTYFEGLNEPVGQQGLTAAQSAAQYSAFRTAVHGANASAKAIGPCEVAFGPVGANSAFLPNVSSLATFLADITVPLDGFSVHDYNSYNGDFNVTDGWLGAIWSTLEAAGYPFGSIPFFFTEVGNILTNVAYFDPHRLVEWAASLYITLERWGCPKEHVFWFYDTTHGFSSNASWIKQANGDLRPHATFFRVYSEEIYGKAYSAPVDFGTIANTFYRGNIYAGTSGKTVALLAQGIPADTVTLAVSDTGSITISDWQGNLSSVTVASGQITVPISDLPVYVRLSASCTLSVVDVGKGLLSGLTANLATAAIATSGSGAATPSRINNNVYETGGYLGSPDGVAFESTTIPDNVVLTWASTQTLGKVVIRQTAPWTNFGPGVAMTGGKLEYWTGAAWVGCPTIANAHWDTAGNYSNTTAVSFLGQIQGADNNSGGNQWLMSFWDNNWNHNVTFSTPVSTTKLRLTVNSTSHGHIPDAFGQSIVNTWAQLIFVSEMLAFGGTASTMTQTFTPPTVQHTPPFLPETKGIARRLFRHMNPQFYGVDVFKLSDNSYVQTESTAENSNVAVPPFPLMPDQKTPNLIARSMYYTAASGYTEVDTTVTPYVVIAYWGGRATPVSAAEVTALTNYTAHGIGYGGCIH